jgi:hypothetical protein
VGPEPGHLWHICGLWLARAIVATICGTNRALLTTAAVAPRHAIAAAPAARSEEEEVMLGGGGCTAQAIAAAGVFDSADDATAALDRLIDTFLSKRRADAHDPAYPRALIGVEGDKWCTEVVAAAVRARRWHFRKLRLWPDRSPSGSERATIDLAAELQAGGAVLLDGTLNKWFLEGADWVNVDPQDPSDPATDPARWRHSVAAVDGVLCEQCDDRIDVSWLWLGASGAPHPNQPDPERGYLRKVKKAFRLVRCSGGPECRGACME